MVRLRHPTADLSVELASSLQSLRHLASLLYLISGLSRLREANRGRLTAGASGDQAIKEREGLGDEVALVPDDQRPAEAVEHRAPLAGVAAELVFGRVQEEQVADVRAYCPQR